MVLFNEPRRLDAIKDTILSQARLLECTEQKATGLAIGTETPSLLLILSRKTSKATRDIHLWHDLPKLPDLPLFSRARLNIPVVPCHISTSVRPLFWMSAGEENKTICERNFPNSTSKITQIPLLIGIMLTVKLSEYRQSPSIYSLDERRVHAPHLLAGGRFMRFFKAVPAKRIPTRTAHCQRGALDGGGAELAVVELIR
jgi:hypothetical protein